MTRFSANLGFLWNDRPLADAIHAAEAAGFDAVECHWPYDQDIDADALDAGAVHVMAGFAAGQEAEACFIGNLRYAAKAAQAAGRTILIEPLNGYDAPGYFLDHSDKARRIIEAVGAPNLKLMFDCYHIQIVEGDLTRRITANLDIIGHVQFAGVPHRGRPDEGEINYRHVFAHLADLGYAAPLGAEYKPAGGDTDASLGWLSVLGDLP